MLHHLGRRHRRGEIQLHRTLSFLKTEHTKILPFGLQENVRSPQIKIIQNADQTIVDKIDTTISTTIPVWKSQMVIALGLSNQRKVLDLQNKADDVTNKLLARNAAALHKGAVDAEKANQRSVVEIDTLEKINAELIATLKETVQIQKEGEANREAAQVKMRQIESDLKNALLENAQQM